MIKFSAAVFEKKDKQLGSFGFFQTTFDILTSVIFENFFIAREVLLSQAHFKNYFYLWSFIVKLWGFEVCLYG